jgi:hypothetical protein
LIVDRNGLGVGPSGQRLAVDVQTLDLAGAVGGYGCVQAALASNLGLQNNGTGRRHERICSSLTA